MDWDACEECSLVGLLSCPESFLRAELVRGETLLSYKYF